MSRCPQCRNENPVDATFCLQCGRRLALSYTPRHLADKILTSRAAIEGERKQVTVLFADLKGSMEMDMRFWLEQARPEIA